MFVLRLLLVNKNPKFSKITQLFIGKLTLRHYFLLKGSSSHSFLYLLSSWSPIQFCQVRNSIVLISLSPFRSCLICLRYGRSLLRFFGTFYFRAFLHLLQLLKKFQFLSHFLLLQQKSIRCSMRFHRQKLICFLV